MEEKLIYIADPMCSWCWGFSPVIHKIKNKYKSALGFELILGGLRPGGGDPWTLEFKNFLRQHWEEVQKRSGQEFSFNLFSFPHFNYDTEPASRAVRVIRDLAPAMEFDFFSNIQRRFYKENQDPGDLAFYEPLVESLKIEWDTFVKEFQSEAYTLKTQQDFQKAARMSIRGFPSLVFQGKTELYLLTHGYSSFEQVEGRIEKYRS